MRPTDYLALYGALLSTVVFVWNVSRALPKLKVRLAHTETGSGMCTGVVASIQNHSAHPVRITRVSILLPFRSKRIRRKLVHLLWHRRWLRTIGWYHAPLSAYGVDDQCPLTVEPGHSHVVFLPADAVESLLGRAMGRQFRVVVQDALWRDTYSHPFIYDNARDA